MEEILKQIKHKELFTFAFIMMLLGIVTLQAGQLVVSALFNGAAFVGFVRYIHLVLKGWQQ